MPPAHPSSRPYGRNPRRRRARPAASDRRQWTDAEPLPCVAQSGKRSIAVEPPGTRRARVVREVVRCIRPIARAGSTACGFRPSLVDGRGALSCVAQPGKRIVAVEPPGARRARVVRCIRPIARAASTASGRSQWTDAKPFREPRSRKSEGYARWCFTSPAHPSSCPCGRNPWRRARFALQAVIGGRTRSFFRASRSRERGSSQWNRPERAGRGWYVRWYAVSVQLPGRRTRFAASGRHWWTEAEPLPCVARPEK